MAEATYDRSKAVVAVARPEHIDLAVPAEPQPIAEIMRHYPSPWVIAGSGGYFAVGGRTRTQPLVTNAYGWLIRQGLVIQESTGLPRPVFCVSAGQARILDGAPPRDAAVAVEAGPWLVRKGQLANLAAEEYRGRYTGLQISSRRPRAGIGVRPDGLVVYAALDAGTLADLQGLLLAEGCRDAMALDGGGSVGVLRRGQAAPVVGESVRALPAAIVIQQEAEVRPDTSAPVQILTDTLPTLLRRGDSGPHVVLLQRLLVLAGLDPGPVDGQFGSRTEAAVRAYQQRHKLTVDGLVGAQTWSQFARPVPIGDAAGAQAPVAEHFRLGEFVCRHCGQVVLLYLPDLCEVLEAVRARVGSPLQITSGYRCPEHNRAVGGSPNSQHLLGKAADVVSTVDPERVADAAEEVLANRGGVFRYPQRRFTHVDIRQTKARGYME